jgi:iduronate 2-sulfatase
MKHIRSILLVAALLAAIPFTTASEEESPSRPNVVLIVCDDLNDYVDGFGGHPQTLTPNMAKLAASGTRFKAAYSNNPVCAPSRSSFLTGIYPHTSNNLFWAKWHENPVLKNSKTIMEYFSDAGYTVAGSGKLMHHHKRDVWDEFKNKTDYGPYVYDGDGWVAHPSVPLPYGSIGAIDGSYAMLEDIPYADDDNQKTGWIYGRYNKNGPVPFNVNEDGSMDLTPDEMNAKWAARRISKFATDGEDDPFFLAVGFVRPHTPLHVQKRYFDKFPMDELELPVIKENDADDTHYREIFTDNIKGLRYFRMLNESYPDQETAIKTFTQAYLACVAAVDECIGQVVEAVEASGLADNTIIVITSDHGWNMGEKDYLFKNSPWEESCRVPMIVRAPGVTKAGTTVSQPVALIDLYPTLVDLCGLEEDNRKNNKGARLDGFSMKPLMENPDCGNWDGPEGALTMVWGGEEAREPFTHHDRTHASSQNWSLRTKKWRYIIYNNGSEELYDHETDPNEWDNVVARHPDVAARLNGEIRRMIGVEKLGRQ